MTLNRMLNNKFIAVPLSSELFHELFHISNVSVCPPRRARHSRHRLGIERMRLSTCSAGIRSHFSRDVWRRFLQCCGGNWPSIHCVLQVFHRFSMWFKSGDDAGQFITSINSVWMWFITLWAMCIRALSRWNTKSSQHSKSLSNRWWGKWPDTCWACRQSLPLNATSMSRMSRSAWRTHTHYWYETVHETVHYSMEQQ